MICHVPIKHLYVQGHGRHVLCLTVAHGGWPMLLAKDVKTHADGTYAWMMYFLKGRRAHEAEVKGRG
jgi:hypothetical protein